MFEIYPLKYNIISNISYQILIFRENCSTGTFALAMQRDKKGRILSPSVVSRGQCTIKGFGESVVTPLQEGCRGRIPLPPREAMPRKRRRAQRGECRLVDGPSEVGTAGRNKDRRGRREEEKGETRKKGREKTGEKMGSQLFFRLACTVPLAITRLERNVFSGLFLASLISNYESETTRWAVAFAGRITPLLLPRLPFLFSATLSRVFQTLIQRLASSNLPP